MGRRVMRLLLRLCAIVLLVVVGFVGLLYFAQHSMIYHPRPYDASYGEWSLPPEAVEISYTVPAGEQTAYYIPGSDAVPHRLWLAFNGNASLARDWGWVTSVYPRNGDAFLLIDYPGYGKNAGYATVASTRATTEAALRKLYQNLGVADGQLALAVIGHSLGAAVAFDFAAHHAVDKVVAIAPFTTLREEAATVVGRPLSHLLVENYDNRANLKEALKKNPALRVAVFHGEDDEVIPFRLGRELAQSSPATEFFAVSGGNHVSVLTLAKQQIIAWMSR